MNFSLTRATLIAEADLIGIAGERAVCDPRGVLYFPDLRLLAVSDLHLEKGSSFARRGSLIPPYDTGATLLRLQAAIADYQPAIVIS
ncbi:MAG: metallophosphatase, partial [Mesorhizobium sp.]